MSGVERRNKILEMINEKKSITVRNGNIFNVTEETIRRDFKTLRKGIATGHGSRFAGRIKTSHP